VGFRYFTADLAHAREVTGWVRNNFDGNVELEAQAESALLDAFLSDVRKGPSLSRVKDMLISELSPVDGEEGFRIRH